MNSPQATVVVVPRERFSLIEECIQRIYTHTPEPFQMIIVEASAPKQVARRLREWESTHPNCRVIRAERFLYPYEAKNLVLPHLTTEWVAFVDSDVMVGPRWLSWLLAAAKETGSRVVHPLYLVEQAGQLKIHMTDGRIKRIQKDGKEWLHPVMGHVTQKVEQARGLLRQESDFLEFHTFFIHCDLLRKMGPFDPFTLAEDVHYSLRLRELKERIIFEPRAVITYIAGPPFESYDMPYFRFRWDLKRGRESTEQLRERWSLTETYCTEKVSWAAYHLSRLSPWFTLFKRWDRVRNTWASRILKFVKRLRSSNATG